MKFKRIMFVSILLLAILAIGAVSAADENVTENAIAVDDNTLMDLNTENTLEISDGENLSTTHTVSGNTFADIQNVINMANEGDTIYLSDLYSGNGNRIKINKALTIEGNGAILDAHAKSGILEITGNNVIVNNITFINGYSASAGAIDWWTGTYDGPKDSYGLVTNSRFINCRADYYAGAVYFFDNELTMKNCYFEANFAKKGGAVYVAGERCSIIECAFYDNFDTDLEQSDIYRDSTVTVTDCIYSNDKDSLNYIPTTYKESEGNTAVSRNYTVPTYKLSGNVVSGKTFADIQNAINNAKGGDVIELTGTYTGNGDTIKVKKAVTIVGVGEAILDAKGLNTIFEITESGVSIFNLKLTKGYSSQEVLSKDVLAGAINCYSNNLYVEDTIFENNNGIYVGGIYSKGSNSILNNCTFTNNKIGLDKGVTYSFIQFDDNGNRYDVKYSYENAIGGAYLNGINSILDYCTFNDNGGKSDFVIKGSILKPVTILDVPSFVKYYGDSKKLSFSLTEDGKPVANAKISIDIGNHISTAVYTDSKGQASFDFDLPIGTYMVVSRHSYDTKVSAVIVEKTNVKIKTSDVVAYYGGNQKIVTQLTKGNSVLSNVNVNIKVNGNVQTVKTDSKGQASINLNLPVGTYDVITEYDGITTNSKITIKSTIAASDISGTYSNAKATATFLDTAGKALASKQATFKIGTATYTATTNANGVAIANIPLAVGTYTVTAINPTTKEEKQFKLTISKADSTVVLSAIQNGKSVTLTATVTPSGATGKITFAVIPTVVYDSGIVQFLSEKRKDYQSNIVNGKATVTIPDLAIGSYSAVVIYDGDSNMMPFESDFTDFKVNKVYSIINAGDTKGTYLDSKVSATFLDGSGKELVNTKVTFKVGGKSFSATTNSKGVATAIIDLNAGTYDVTAVNPSTKEEKQFKLTISKVTGKIVPQNLNAEYASGTFTFKLVDSATNKPLTGKLIYSIYNAGRSLTADKNGIVTIDNSNLQMIKYENGVLSVKNNLDVGKHLIIIKGNDSNVDVQEIEFELTVSKIAPILSANSFTAVYGDSKYFIITLKESDGTPIPNQEILFSAYSGDDHYYFITDEPHKTNANGQVKLKINYLPDHYTFYVSSKNCKEISKKIVIKKITPKISAKDKTFKKSVKTKKYTITLKTNKNKAMKNTKVYIKVNGKTYTAKTNSKGVATFKITKLTKKGKFTSTITYKGNTYYNKLTKKVKITIK